MMGLTTIRCQEERMMDLDAASEADKQIGALGEKSPY